VTTQTTATKLRVAIGHDRFEAEGEQAFVERCLTTWVEDMARIYRGPIRKMTAGDLYG
jgi:hypothetical protein